MPEHNKYHQLIKLHREGRLPSEDYPTLIRLVQKHKGFKPNKPIRDLPCPLCNQPLILSGNKLRCQRNKQNGCGYTSP